MAGNNREYRGAAHIVRRPGVVAAAVVAAGLLAIALTGCSSATVLHRPAAASEHTTKYGSLPRFLPPQSFDTDRILTGSVTRPALTAEGDTVRVGSGRSAALITVAGPEVPGEGLPYQASASTCTWTVTITAGTTPVGIDAKDFWGTDHLGAVYAPNFVADQPAPPKSVAPQASVSFELRAVMVVGEGLMRWAPDGTHPVAAWDFEVEND